MGAECIFCSIASGEVLNHLVHDGKHLIAFQDIHPQAPTHIVLIPRAHISTMNDLTNEHASLIGELVLLAKQIATDQGFAQDGYRIVMNCLGHGGQTVFHLHLHLLGGRQMHWPPG